MHYLANKEKIKERSRLYRKNNKQMLKEYHHEYHIKNRNGIKEYSKQYYEDNKERIRENNQNYYADHKEEIIEQHKKYVSLNKSKVAKTQKEYRENNKEYLKEKGRQYRLKHKDDFIYKRNRRDRWLKRKAAMKSLPAEDVNSLDIFERDGWICQLCKKKVNKKLKHPHPMSASLDHIVPISDNGPHLKTNCQLAHLRCNVSVGTGGVKQLRMFG